MSYTTIPSTVGPAPTATGVYGGLRHPQGHAPDGEQEGQEWDVDRFGPFEHTLDQ